MSIRLQFTEGFPKEIKKPVEAIVRPFLDADLMPWWIRQVNVTYDPDETVAIALFASFEGYRTCRITIGAKWIHEPESVRREVLYHELSHSYVDRAWDMVVGILKHFEEDNPEFHKLASDAFKQQMEAAVTDISIALAKRLDATSEE